MLILGGLTRFRNNHIAEADFSSSLRYVDNTPAGKVCKDKQSVN